MLTKKQREDAFRIDMDALLAKHRAAIEIVDDDLPYGKSRGIVVVTMMNEYDRDGNKIAEYTLFRL